MDHIKSWWPQENHLGKGDLDKTDQMTNIDIEKWQKS